MFYAPYDKNVWSLPCAEKQEDDSHVRLATSGLGMGGRMCKIYMRK